MGVEVNGCGLFRLLAVRWSREQPITVSSPSLLFRLSHAGFIRPSVRSSSLLRLRSPCSSRTCPAAPLVWRPLCLLACRVWQVIFQQIVAISDGTGCRTGRLDADAQAHHLRVGLRRFSTPHRLQRPDVPARAYGEGLPRGLRRSTAAVWCGWGPVLHPEPDSPSGDGPGGM